MILRSHPGDGRHDWSWRRLAGGLAALGIAVGIATTLGLSSRGTGAAPVDGSGGFAESLPPPETTVQVSARDDAPAPAAGIETIASLSQRSSDAPRMRLRYSRSLRSAARPVAISTEHKPMQAQEPAPMLREHALTVRPGDSLFTLFKAEGLALEDLAAIMAAGKSTAALSRLRPGDRITVTTDAENRVQGLTHKRPRGKTLNVARDGNTFRTGVEVRPANAAMAAMVTAGSDNSNDWVELHEPTRPLKRRSVSISNGDSLYSIFKSNGFQLADLAAIVKASNDTRRLARLVPGQRLDFHVTSDNSVSKLVYYLDDTRALHVRRNGIGYDSKFVDVPLDRHMASAAGTIDASLFVAGQRAGLSNNIIMQMVEIFGWDVDFALDIRAGDRFAVVYEALYKNGEKLKDGNILAAMFTNRGKTTRVVRYEYSDGHSAYFTPEGVSIRKAFLRSPVSYSRITSRFSRSRLHPKLHRFRAHRGVDYAAARGTRIKAAGDGKVVFIGYKGSYGKTIVLRHGAVYTTLYAHMSRFARGLRRGQRVSQGQAIGYIGSTGLATGPHLHYEFRVRGVHRNPLRVKLPKAAPIEKKYQQDFLVKIRDLVARLDVVTNPILAADERRLTDTD
jgi:murein DD-endopeptidase MepM/ murein hydrolase activator NlpD